MAGIDYSERIPNNVRLGDDRVLQRALEKWQPAFLDWWQQLGPEGFQSQETYLRTATSVDAKGWATFGHVKTPEYRWGIFLADADQNRTIPAGDHQGEAVWQEVPGEHRSDLRKLIVTQGDTEPASVEQQRLLGQTAPSLYDLRNLLQVNVEEGRHLWAMVYLLHAHFGRDGREEAEQMLERHSGNSDRPRILTTFNEPIEDWLSFFMFTYFTDRDGKYQLKCLAESGFDPLARTCRFMLTEEAHHMFVGRSGLGRVIKRTLEIMRAHNSDDPETVRRAGGIDLPTIQRYINFWFSSALDLFGQEVSSNAASTFANGLKGRPDEHLFTDHRCLGTDTVEIPDDLGQPIKSEVPARNGINEVVRRAYIDDCEVGLKRWNKMIRDTGFGVQLKLPAPRFRRSLGFWSRFQYSPDGQLLTPAEWEQSRDVWLPTQRDREFVKSLMVPVYEPGKVAGWLAAPEQGINNQTLDYEYVRL
jgi:benzoyl-CoA 2,3-dioxygenase component B